MVGKIALNNITGNKKADYWTIEKKTIDGLDYGTTEASWTAPYIYHLYYQYLGWAMNSEDWKVTVD